MTPLRTAAQQAIALICSARLCEVNSMSSRQEMLRLLIEATDTLRAALAEPDIDPVAWLWQHRETGRTRVLMPDERTVTDVAAAWDVVGPLYLAPPQRKPLTEEEIEKAYREIWRDLPSDFDHTSSGWIEQGIKYAERAHGIT